MWAMPYTVDGIWWGMSVLLNSWGTSLEQWRSAGERVAKA